MGYRLSVKAATFPSAPLPHGTRSFGVSVSVVNFGFSAPINRRPLHIVLIAAGGETLSVDLVVAGVDVRTWQPRFTADPFAIPRVHTFTLDVPTSNLRAGQEYELGLWLPDERLPTAAAGAIRFANEEGELPWRVWGSSSGGINVLGVVEMLP